MTDLSTLARAAKRVTLDDVYSAIDSLKGQQSEDSRNMNQRIDTVSQRVDNLGTRIDNIGSRMDAMMQMLMEISKQLFELSKQKS